MKLFLFFKNLINSFLGSKFGALLVISLNIILSTIICLTIIKIIPIPEINTIDETLLKLYKYQLKKSYSSQDLINLINIMDSNVAIKLHCEKLNILSNKKQIYDMMYTGSPNFNYIKKNLIQSDLKTVVDILEIKKEEIHQSYTNFAFSYLAFSTITIIFGIYLLCTIS